MLGFHVQRIHELLQHYVTQSLSFSMYVPQERLMCNCICMITRLCMQSQTNTFESYRSIKQHMYLYKYMLVLRTASVSNFRCASSTRAKRKVTTGRSNITANRMSLSSLSLPFYLGLFKPFVVTINLNSWYKKRTHDGRADYSVGFGRVSEEGTNGLIRGFHATCVTHSQCSEHRFIAFIPIRVHTYEWRSG